MVALFDTLAQGLSNNSDKACPWVLKWYLKITCPAEGAVCSISVHNGLILVAEPLQNQVQKKKLKEPLQIKIF